MRGNCSYCGNPIVHGKDLYALVGTKYVHAGFRWEVESCEAKARDLIRRNPELAARMGFHITRDACDAKR